MSVTSVIQVSIGVCCGVTRFLSAVRVSFIKMSPSRFRGNHLWQLGKTPRRIFFGMLFVAMHLQVARRCRHHESLHANRALVRLFGFLHSRPGLCCHEGFSSICFGLRVGFFLFLVQLLLLLTHRHGAQECRWPSRRALRSTSVLANRPHLSHKSHSVCLCK